MWAPRGRRPQLELNKDNHVVKYFCCCQWTAVWAFPYKYNIRSSLSTANPRKSLQPSKLLSSIFGARSYLLSDNDNFFTCNVVGAS